MTHEMQSSEFDKRAFASNYPQGAENNFWNVARNLVIEDELKAAVRSGLIERNSPILEIGCGPGIVVKYLRGRGWAVSGCELGAPVVLAGIEHVIWTRRSAVELDQDFRGTVKCILLLDVIEHIADDIAFLKELIAAFPACNCFIIAVPARTEVWSNYDDYYGHFRRYDRALLTNSFRSAGLAITRQRYFFHALYVAAALFNIFKRKRNVYITATRRPLVDRLIAAAMHLESRIVPSSMPGLSLIGTAVRPERKGSIGG
jgi:SAM-dependent methyltransferase